LWNADAYFLFGDEDWRIHYVYQFKRNKSDINKLCCVLCNYFMVWHFTARIVTRFLKKDWAENKWAEKRPTHFNNRSGLVKRVKYDSIWFCPWEITFGFCNKLVFQNIHRFIINSLNHWDCDILKCLRW